MEVAVAVEKGEMTLEELIFAFLDQNIAWAEQTIAFIKAERPQDADSLPALEQELEKHKQAKEKWIKRLRGPFNEAPDPTRLAATLAHLHT